MNKVLIIAAHPDDEILGCGGVIAKHIKDGDKVDVVIAGEGITSRKNELREKEKLDKLKREANEANELLGVNNIYLEGLPDNRLDKLLRLETVKVVEKYINKSKPNIIYTHFGNDLNVDHQIVNQAVVTASRPQKNNSVKSLFFFEVPSSTEWRIDAKSKMFNPNWFEDISSFKNKKFKALKAYSLELRKWPHPRSIKGVESLVSWRGATVGVDAAEAFILGRKIK